MYSTPRYQSRYSTQHFHRVHSPTQRNHLNRQVWKLQDNEKIHLILSPLVILSTDS